MPAEEANSEARYHFDGRDRLHSCTFKVEMCIRACLPLLDSANITILDDFNVKYGSLNLDLEEMIAEDNIIKYVFKH